jgi:hypothetical protein
MNAPALFIGAALIFWGWQTGLWFLAFPLALIFEGSRLIRRRWDLAAADFMRISNGCTFLFIGLLIYLVVSNRSAHFIFVLLQWFPIIFFPLLAAQAYSTSDCIDIRALFLFPRRKKKSERQERTSLNLTYPYFAICILSASAANIRNVSFFMGLFALLSLMLWFVRSRRFSPAVWGCMIAIAGSVGLVGHIGLHRLQLTLEQKGLEWFSDFKRIDSDPFQTKTAIGDIGALKPSNRIVFRVDSNAGRTSPILLQEAIYNRYLSSMWVATNPGFIPVQPDTNRTTWRFRRDSANGTAITVASNLHKGRGVLKLPDGAFQVDQLPAARMERNKFGTVKVEGQPDMVSYRVQFDKSCALKRQPTEDDLQIPLKEKPALKKIVNELGLEEKSSREILNATKTFFQDKFRYSLELSGKGHHSTPLAAFLLQTRFGHCEYFATATVLLLRAAGIPACYVKGYSVHEFSRLENQFIVRDRHAHAWTQVYMDGAWHQFDTTPAAWASIENADASSWELFSDLWSLCGFKLSVWLSWVRDRGRFEYLGWLIIPFIFIVVWFFYQKKRVGGFITEETAELSAQYPQAGSDSEFYFIEKALNQSGYARLRSETLQNWIKRLQTDFPASGVINDLKSILDLHYRYRFDPKGIKPIERLKLKTNSRLWLEQYNKSTDL